MKKSISVLLLLTFCAQLFSCSNKQELAVSSVSYPGLTKMTKAELPNQTELTEYLYTYSDDYLYGVSVENDRLIINANPEDKTSYALHMNSACFEGVDLGAHGGFCKLYEPGDINGKVISPTNCNGIFPKTPNDLNNGYMISKSIDSNGTSIYKLSRNAEECWEYNVIATFDTTTVNWHYSADDHMLYIVSESLLKVNLETGEVTAIYENKNFRLYEPNSIVELNGKLYIGSMMGVFEHDLETGVTDWYQIDYEKYLPDYLEVKNFFRR